MTLQAGYEPLLEAISDGDLRSLDRLLNTNRYSVNAEIGYNSEDNKPYIITPLYWAVKVGQREVCRFLLQRGADPYRHMVYEYYPLHEACNRGDEGIVQEFISAHCNLEHPNCDGDTPLHIASMRGHLECIRLLLNAGVDRTKQNVKGQTPLQAAQYTNQTDLYKLFEVFERGKLKVHAHIYTHVSLCIILLSFRDVLIAYLWYVLWEHSVLVLVGTKAFLWKNSKVNSDIYFFQTGSVWIIPSTNKV